MSYVLDIATSDDYQFFSCPGSSRITQQVSNAAVLIGYGAGGRGQPQAAVYGVDEPFLPTTAGLYRECDAIRVRNYAPGTPARVMIAAQ